MNRQRQIGPYLLSISKETLIVSEWSISKHNMSARSSKGSSGPRAYKKKRTESFNLYIFKVLKQVHPEIEMSQRAMKVMNGIEKDGFDRIADRNADEVGIQ